MVSFFFSTFLPLFHLRHQIHALVLGYAGQQAIKRPRVLLVLPLTQQKSYCANSVPELLWKYILYKYLVFWWGRFLIPFFQSKSSIFTRMFHVHTKCRIQHLKTRKDTKIIVLRKKALNFCTDWNFCTTISSTYEHDRHISQSI